MFAEAWVSGGAEPDPDARQYTVGAPDGRILGVAEYGPSDGRPIFSLHGTPGCRYGGAPPEHPTLYEDRNVRVIHYDRPGYGLSTRHPGRSVADCAADVAAIADRLGIDQFAVTGGSGGGPHCLAVAALLPQRVTRVACVVGVAPVDNGEFDFADGMTQGNVDEFTWATQGESVLRPQLERLAADDLNRLGEGKIGFGDAYEMAEGDLEILARPAYADRFTRTMTEAYRTGVDGWCDDNLVFVKPWGFGVEQVGVPAMVWYGVDDTLVPMQHGVWLAHHVPGAIAVAMSGGHMELANRVPDLIAWLLGGEAPADAFPGVDA
jgi:pimeloyl-ACP methyl ester carboxylesterase